MTVEIHEKQQKASLLLENLKQYFTVEEKSREIVFKNKLGAHAFCINITGEDLRSVLIDFKQEALSKDDWENALPILIDWIDLCMGAKRFAVYPSQLINAAMDRAYATGAMSNVQRARQNTINNMIDKIALFRDQCQLVDTFKEYDSDLKICIAQELLAYKDTIKELMQKSGFAATRMEVYNKMGEEGIRLFCMNHLTHGLVNSQNKLVAIFRVTELSSDLKLGFLADTLVDEDYFAPRISGFHAKAVGTAYLYHRVCNERLNLKINHLLLVVPPGREEEFKQYGCEPLNEMIINDQRYVILVKWGQPEPSLKLEASYLWQKFEQEVSEFQLQLQESKNQTFEQTIPVSLSVLSQLSLTANMNENPGQVQPKPEEQFVPQT